MSEKAMIFDIVRSSFVDGPGIRTTVFFKGCNLKCAWCHNPESQSTKKQLLFYENRCTHCGQCKTVCPNHMESCSQCGSCADVCPHDARQLCGEEITVQEIVAKVAKDTAFYTTSGGGITLSGGECMLYPAFIVQLLCVCRELGIHTAIDTAGAVPWHTFEQVMPVTNLFLYDLKAMDPEVHQRYVGTHLSLILDNYRKLIQSGSHVWVRVPVIPGVNDDQKQLDALYDLLKAYPPEKVELLPYHAMGEHKYGGLGKELIKFAAPDQLWFDKLKQRFAAMAKT
jgi:glycyl-radical enzyme activating protein